MNNLIISLLSSIFIGVGATLTFDLWGLILKRAFKIAPSNFCLVGRWVLYLPDGIFRHSNIGSALPKKSECATGWFTHYLTGTTFTCIFLAFIGSDWLQRPTFISALLFGMITVAAPFFIMQPVFGQGVAASKTAKPTQARLRSLMNHTVFGFGIYLFGFLLNLVI